MNEEKAKLSEGSDRQKRSDGMSSTAAMPPAADGPMLAPPTDCGRSFIVCAGAPHGNAPLFWIESRCRITDAAGKAVRDYYQCGSCKSEDTFGSGALFLTPNYDFIFEVPTPLTAGGRESAQVYHYSETCKMATRNQVLAVDLE